MKRIKPEKRKAPANFVAIGTNGFNKVNLELKNGVKLEVYPLQNGIGIRVVSFTMLERLSMVQTGACNVAEIRTIET